SDLQRFDDFTSKYQSFNGIPLRVGIIQPIFGFNSIKWDQKINALSLGIAAKKIDFDIENVKRTAASLFIEALLASSNLEIAITNEIINEKLVTIANERYILGKLSMDEKLQLENALASAKLSKIQFTTQFQNRLMDLDNFLAKDYGQQDTLLLELPEPLPRLFVDEDQAINQALTNNFNLESFAQQLIQADRDINKASVDNGLQMSLRASFGLARGSTTLSDIYQDPYGERQISVGVDIPIVNWGRKKEAVKIASLQKDLVNTQISQSKAVIINNVRRVVQAFNVLQDEVAIQKKIMENATQRFEISNQRYILGNIALTDLTIAQADKDRSKRDYVMSVAKYWDAYYGIRMLTGFDFVSNQKIQN
ncbi:MAG TPA: TolC family protein, partial [Saprospiraceae bacterium]|nr:TolC family protein [Saprospiraceae bacterium]